MEEVVDSVSVTSLGGTCSSSAWGTDYVIRERSPVAGDLGAAK